MMLTSMSKIRLMMNMALQAMRMLPRVISSLRNKVTSPRTKRNLQANPAIQRVAPKRSNSLSTPIIIPDRSPENQSHTNSLTKTPSISMESLCSPLRNFSKISQINWRWTMVRILSNFANSFVKNLWMWSRSALERSRQFWPSAWFRRVSSIQYSFSMSQLIRM